MLKDTNAFDDYLIRRVMFIAMKRLGMTVDMYLVYANDN